MLRKVLFKADMIVGIIARKAYKKAGTDTFTVRMLDAAANFICWLDITLVGHDKVYEALVEYAEVEREKNIKAGIYVDPFEGTVEAR